MSSEAEIQAHRAGLADDEKSSRTSKYLAVRQKEVPLPVRWSLLLFVLTFPFETVDVGTQSVSISRILGFLFFLCYFPFYNPFFGNRSLATPTPPLYWFIGYVVIFAAGAVLTEPIYHDLIRVRLFTFIQLLVLLWILSGLLENMSLTKKVLLTYSVASVILAVAIMLNAPWVNVSMSYGRITALREDMNQLSMVMGLAALILIGLIGGRDIIKHSVTKLALALMIVPLLVVIVQTGSRTGTLAVLAGALVYVLPNFYSRLERSSKRQLAVMILAACGAITLLYLVATNPVMMERWQGAYHEHDLAYREIVFPVAFEMITERPLLGWLPVRSWFELGSRIGDWNPMDTHNLIVNLMVEGGVLGTSPFLIALALCFAAAWRARTGELGLLPLVVLVAMLVANLGIPYQTGKPFWLVMAICIAAAASATTKRLRPNRVFLVRARSSKGRDRLVLLGEQ